MTVGNNKLLFVHFICDSGTDYSSSSMFEKHMIIADIPTVYDRSKYFSSKLLPIEENDIYQIIILNPFGREIGCEVAKTELRNCIMLSPHELHCISVNERDREEYIPRYIDAKKRLSMMIPPTMVSELNGMEIYTSNHYSFYLSDEYDPKTVSTYFAPGDSLDYVIRAVKKEDRHLTRVRKK